MTYAVNSIVNNLVSEGIIGFDTGMQVTGQVPLTNSPIYPDMPSLKSQPQKDEMIKEDDSLTVIKTPLWKKVLFAALAIGGIAYGGYKFKSKLLPYISSGWQKCKDFVLNLFKKSTPPTPAP